MAFHRSSHGVTVSDVAFYYAQLGLVEDLSHVAHVKVVRT